MNFSAWTHLSNFDQSGQKIGHGAWPTHDYSEKTEKYLSSWGLSSLLAFLNNWLNFCVRGQFEIKILIQSNLDYPYYLIIQSFFSGPNFSMNINYYLWSWKLKVAKSPIILSKDCWNSVLSCALFKIRKCDETKKYSDAFSWYLIGSIVLLPREFHAWLVPSAWVM